jgi:hypothetical protein
MLKLSQIQTQTGFTAEKDARNLADWLRAARGEQPAQRLDGEIAYTAEFVKQVLQYRIERIEKKYPHALETVKSFISNENQNAHEKPDSTRTSAQAAQTNTETDSSPEVEPIQGTAHENGFNSNPHTVEIVASNALAGHGGQTEPTPTAQPVQHAIDPLREALTSQRALLWATMFAILIFLPFTALNLWQYIAIKPESDAGQWAVFVLCWLIALIWDFSILLFAVNGKRNLAAVGASVLFVFMASKFDFFRMLFGGLGYDGESIQLGCVIFCIVSYTPLLLFQLTELAVKK